MAGPAAMGEPAHDGAVAADHLHPVDADIDLVAGRVVRPPRNDQRPGEERRRLARPVDLHRQAGEVDLLATPHDLLRWRCMNLLWPHRHRGTGERHLRHRVGEIARWPRLAEFRQHFPERTKARGINAEPPTGPLGGAEQIDEHRHRGRASIRHDAALRTAGPGHWHAGRGGESRSLRARPTPAPGFEQGAPRVPDGT